MAASSCPNTNCTAKGFEMKNMTVWYGSEQRMVAALQCAGCGCVVGILDADAVHQRTLIARGINKILTHLKI